MDCIDKIAARIRGVYFMRECRNIACPASCGHYFCPNKDLHHLITDRWVIYDGHVEKWIKESEFVKRKMTNFAGESFCTFHSFITLHALQPQFWHLTVS